MNFESYLKDQRADYARLADVVASILTAAIRAQPRLRLEHIQTRAKESGSLRKKLESAGALESDKIEDLIKDLAGCRLVFYTNSDVARFASSGIISDNFEVDWDRTKIHHPDPQATAAAELFISNNYVVRLSEPRASLPEYERFRGMSCEVQVQTTLNHAWSEMAHDTIYKKPALTGFGKSLMEDIEARMKTIMDDHLRPAGYEFQKVVDDFERFSSGKALFDRGALKALTECRDNNARHDLLQRFAAYVLPHYDDPKQVQNEVRSTVVAVVKQARDAPVRAIDTPFGALAGHTSEQIVNIAADVLDYLRYSDVEATFDVIGELYLGAKTDGERKRLLQSAEKLSKHELDVWKVAGPHVQQVLVERIGRLDLAAPTTARPVVLQVLGQVLRSEVTGTKSTHDAMTIQTSAIAPSKELKEARANATRLLMGVFELAESDADRRSVVHLFSGALAMPRRGAASKELRTLLLNDAIDIVEFYTAVSGTQSFELLQEIEHGLLWLYRRTRDMPAEVAADPDVATARGQLLTGILAFRGRVNADRHFAVYKTLVGYQSVFPPAWEDNKFDVEGEDAYREQQILALVDDVTEARADEWLAILRRCAQTDSGDGATFRSFGQFLEAVGRAKPSIVISYQDRLDDRLANFLPSLLFGLEEGGQGEFVAAKIRAWVDGRQYLGQIVRYQRFAPTLDAVLLEDALVAAMALGDDQAVLNAISVCAARHGDVAEGLVDSVFLPALRYLTAKGETGWVHVARSPAAKPSVFASLSSAQADEVLTNLVAQPQIEHAAERILTRIAATWPEKVIDFFGSRLSHEPTDTGDVRYEAVPFEFHDLQGPLATVPTYLVEKARGWYSGDERLFAYRGGRMVTNTFPALTPEVEKALRDVLHRGSRDDAEFVIKILRNYNGQNFIHELCKATVELLPENDPLLGEVEIALDSTGVLHGEFGLVEAYRSKVADLDPWRNDTRERVRSFAKRYAATLERQIAAEQRRSEEQLKLRKRRYGGGSS